MKMKEFFKDVRCWVRGVFVNDSPPTACCIVGAVNFCYPHEPNHIYDKMAKYLGTRNFTYWNDHKATFEDVKKMCEVLDI